MKKVKFSLLPTKPEKERDDFFLQKRKKSKKKGTQYILLSV